MNLLGSLLISVFAVNVCWQPDYNHVTITNSKVIIQAYCDEDDNPLFKKKYNVEQFKKNRYFKLGQDTIYLDYDENPVFSEPLSDYFSKKVLIFQNEISGRHHLYKICFVIDKNGQIKESGFLEGDGNGMYREQLVQIMSYMEQAINPGKINGKNVAVLYSFEIDLSSKDFK